ncbi:MAG: sulfite exporter TauE/SafE family protein [Gammaproteobacteria bacterium]
MSYLDIGLLIVVGMAAGGLGALTGMGGGVVIVPVLTLGFGLPAQLAIGASIFGVVATSIGAARRVMASGLTNLRAGLVLQVAASGGALIGVVIAHLVSSQALILVFGIMLLPTVVLSYVSATGHEAPVRECSRSAAWFGLGGSYTEADGSTRSYGVIGLGRGFAMMIGAGLLSALLGIGSGVFKVLAMDRFMCLPFRVSTATSNFMIGITAATGAGYYLSHGDTPPLVVAPIVLGILAGSALGARLLPLIRVVSLRRLFTLVLSLVAVEMILRGLGVA